MGLVWGCVDFSFVRGRIIFRNERTTVITYRRKIGRKRGSVWCKHTKPGYTSNECARVQRELRAKQLREETRLIVMRWVESRHSQEPA